MAPAWHSRQSHEQARGTRDGRFRGSRGSWTHGSSRAARRAWERARCGWRSGWAAKHCGNRGLPYLRSCQGADDTCRASRSGSSSATPARSFAAGHLARVLAEPWGRFAGHVVSYEVETPTFYRRRPPRGYKGALRRSPILWLGFLLGLRSILSVSRMSLRSRTPRSLGRGHHHPRPSLRPRRVALHLLLPGALRPVLTPLLLSLLEQ
jgi:hypothetical protein